MQRIAQNVDFLPCGAAAADPSELFLSRTAVDRLAELRAEYDYIILMHLRSRQLRSNRPEPHGGRCGCADASGYHEDAERRKLQKKLQAVNASILGAVLNGSEA